MGTGKLSVYLQIVEDIKRKIEIGLLRGGDKLASCREFALKLGINPNTVQRAYSTLEEEGYIYTVPKKGVYVAQRNKTVEIESVAEEKLAELKDGGLTKQQILKIIDKIYGGEL